MADQQAHPPSPIWQRQSALSRSCSGPMFACAMSAMRKRPAGPRSAHRFSAVDAYLSPLSIMARLPRDLVDPFRDNPVPGTTTASIAPARHSAFPASRRRSRFGSRSIKGSHFRRRKHTQPSRMSNGPVDAPTERDSRQAGAAVWPRPRFCDGRIICGVIVMLSQDSVSPVENRPIYRKTTRRSAPEDWLPLGERVFYRSQYSICGSNTEVTRSIPKHAASFSGSLRW